MDGAVPPEDHGFTNGSSKSQSSPREIDDPMIITSSSLKPSRSQSENQFTAVNSPPSRRESGPALLRNNATPVRRSTRFRRQSHDPLTDPSQSRASNVGGSAMPAATSRGQQCHYCGTITTDTPMKPSSGTDGNPTDHTVGRQSTPEVDDDETQPTTPRGRLCLYCGTLLPSTDSPLRPSPWRKGQDITAAVGLQKSYNADGFVATHTPQSSHDDSRPPGHPSSSSPDSPLAKRSKRKSQSILGLSRVSSFDSPLGNVPKRRRRTDFGGARIDQNLAGSERAPKRRNGDVDAIAEPGRSRQLDSKGGHYSAMKGIVTQPASSLYMFPPGEAGSSRRSARFALPPEYDGMHTSHTDVDNSGTNAVAGTNFPMYGSGSAGPTQFVPAPEYDRRHAPRPMRYNYTNLGTPYTNVDSSGTNATTRPAFVPGPPSGTDYRNGNVPTWQSVLGAAQGSGQTNDSETGSMSRGPNEGHTLQVDDRTSTSGLILINGNYYNAMGDIVRTDNVSTWPTPSETDNISNETRHPLARAYQGHPLSYSIDSDDTGSETRFPSLRAYQRGKLSYNIDPPTTSTRSTLASQSDGDNIPVTSHSQRNNSFNDSFNNLMRNLRNHSVDPTSTTTSPTQPTRNEPDSTPVSGLRRLDLQQQRHQRTDREYTTTTTLPGVRHSLSTEHAPTTTLPGVRHILHACPPVREANNPSPRQNPDVGWARRGDGGGDVLRDLTGVARDLRMPEEYDLGGFDEVFLRKYGTGGGSRG